MMRHFKHLVFGLLLGCGIIPSLWAAEANHPPSEMQQPQSLNDTTAVLSDRPLKSPLGAVLRSAVVPGWGQFYTRHHLKGIVAFGVDTFLFASIFYYHHRWRTTGRQHFRDQRNTFTFYFGLAYALTLIDAYVDASLFGFNKAIQFSMLPGTRKPAVGLKIQWRLK